MYLFLYVLGSTYVKYYYIVKGYIHLEWKFIFRCGSYFKSELNLGEFTFNIIWVVFNAYLTGKALGDGQTYTHRAVPGDIFVEN